MAWEFEIDVSGSDLLSKNYSIVVSEKKTNNIRGFKFEEKLIQDIQEKYTLGKSERIKKMLKIRIYCIVIYYLFKDLKISDKTLINLTLCRDFHGHERDISSQLKYFIEDLLKLSINIHYGRLEKESNADRYAYLISKDKNNLVKGYVNISFEDFEQFLNKRREK